MKTSCAVILTGLQCAGREPLHHGHIPKPIRGSLPKKKPRETQRGCLGSTEGATQACPAAADSLLGGQVQQHYIVVLCRHINDFTNPAPPSLITVKSPPPPAARRGWRGPHPAVDLQHGYTWIKSSNFKQVWLVSALDSQPQKFSFQILTENRLSPPAPPCSWVGKIRTILR